MAMPAPAVRDVRVLLHLQRASPRLPERSLSSGRRMAAAATVHVLAAAMLWLVPPASVPMPLDVRTARSERLTWIQPIAAEDFGSRVGGGGGGGNRRRAPALPPQPARTPDVAPPSQEASADIVEPPPEVPSLVFVDDDEPAAVADLEAVGMPVSGEGTASGGHGLGSGGGFGDGEGRGIGPGVGSGVGPGVGGGTGGGVYRPGGGVTTPVVVKQVRPAYPEEAMRERIQGSVALDVIVRADGTPEVLRIVRAIDRGPLDREAERAVRQWRFLPGRRDGVPVDVLVTVLIDFVLY